MRYSVLDSDITAESRVGADGKRYTVRVWQNAGRYQSELILCAAFDSASQLCDASVSDSDSGETFADYFKAPFGLDTLECGPELTESEIAYANTFFGAKLYYSGDGFVFLRFLYSEREYELNYSHSVESAG